MFITTTEEATISTTLSTSRTTVISTTSLTPEPKGESDLKCVQELNLIFAAVIITGGDPNSKSVEVLREDGSFWCTLPDFDSPRSWHTQSGFTACGGEYMEDEYFNDTKTSCVTLGSSWCESHKLQCIRHKHSSWLTPEGKILLLGGEDTCSMGGNSSSAEIVTKDGDGEMVAINRTM